MGKLQEVIADAQKRQNVINDCVQLIDDEVSAKGGLTGLAVKGAYAIVKKIKPGFIREVVDKLIDEFVERLEPFYADFAKQGQGTLSSYLSGRSGEVANALLGVTDARAVNAENRTIKSAYDKLRPTAAKHVEAAVPGVGRVLGKYV